LTSLASLFLLATETKLTMGWWNGTKKTTLLNGAMTVMSREERPLIRLTRDILTKGRYDKRVRPVVNHRKTLPIHISMSLYQIIEVFKYQDEPAQNIKLNVWMIQRWKDEFLYWNPAEYRGIDRTVLPYNVLWIPDTHLYNSVVMQREETEKYMNVQVESLYERGENASYLSFLYPAVYTLTCRLNVRYFPYDQQNCTLTISSWTNSKSALDYYADSTVNLASFIPNEEWHVVKFDIHRHEHKYACCKDPWVLIQASLVIRRKPLYYLVSLIIPSSIITLVAITGFFTPASMFDDRTEKIHMGITTLLAMSILMHKEFDRMPTTSEFVPLIGWFYLTIIIIISIGTFLTSVILSMQSRPLYGRCPHRLIRQIFFVWMIKLLWMDVPRPLQKLWDQKIRSPSSSRPRQLVLSSLDDCKIVLRDRTFTVLIFDLRPFTRVGTVRIPAVTVAMDNSCTTDMVDFSLPSSPLLRSGRRGSDTRSESAIILHSNCASSRLCDMETIREKPIEKKQRQVSMEWEFLASILDRILLIVFITAVVLITLGLIVSVWMAE
ncbi:hypothetical protein PMAYCL1PPCAC_16986, partial [Pristionchus mayeri]